ncbi:MAG: DnaB-like helicase C-terminal domain-containing protein [Nitrososphaeria archaeon]
MLYEEFKYKEFTRSLNVRGKIIDISSQFKVNLNEECYYSLYRFDENIFHHIRKYGTIAGYSGPVYCDYLWLDFDSESGNINTLIERLRLFLDSLGSKYHIPFDSLRLYFSGNKGFHLGIDSRLFEFSPSPDLPKLQKWYASTICGDYITPDLAIYNSTRLFRVPNSLNKKKGLHKIPLTIEEIFIFDYDDIASIATEKREVNFDDSSVDYTMISGILLNFLPPFKEEGIKEIVNDDNLNGIRAKSCLWNMLSSSVKQGERDETAIRIAVELLKNGLSTEFVKTILLQWNRKNDPPLPEETIYKKIESAIKHKYDYGCNDNILSKYCSPDCILKKKNLEVSASSNERKRDGVLLLTYSEIMEYYRDYIESIAKRRVNLWCLPKIDKAIRGIGPGEVGVIIARPAVGKSILLQNIVHDIASIQNLSCIIFSLELPKELLFERGLSIANEIPTSEVERIMINGNSDDIIRSINILTGIYVVDYPTLSIEDVEEISTRIDDLGMICIDYLGLLISSGRSIYEKVSEIARQLKGLAKKLNVPVIVAGQTSRSAGDGTTPITLEMGRDSGSIEEGADFLIGMWRDQEQPQDYIVCRLLKNRRGPSGITEILGFKNGSCRLFSLGRED